MDQSTANDVLAYRACDSADRRHRHVTQSVATTGGTPEAEFSGHFVEKGSAIFTGFTGTQLLQPIHFRRVSSWDSDGRRDSKSQIEVDASTDHRILRKSKKPL